MKIITEEEIEKLQSMADWMDSKFHIPGTSIRFGFDSILGFIPGIGDTVTLASTLYLMSRAHAYRLPWHLKITMFWNLFIDWIIGIIPIVGDIFDIGWKANQKNVALIKKYIYRADHIQVVSEKIYDTN